MLVGDSAKCPRCSFEFILDDKQGECAGCGNKYEFQELDNFRMISWDQEGIDCSRVDKCKKCGERVVEYLSESEKFVIIKTECEKCKISEESIYRKAK